MPHPAGPSLLAGTRDFKPELFKLPVLHPTGMTHKLSRYRDY